MIGRPFQVDWDPEDTPEALRTAYRAQQDTMLRTRLHALWLLRSGRRMREVSTVHYRTLQRWVSWYKTGGVEEVLSHRMKGLGQPRFLSEYQERELTEEVRRWVEGRIYGSIEEKIEAVNAYLRRLESDPGRVRSLAGWDWIEEAVQSLPS